MSTKIDHLEVFYTDRANGWASAAFDSEGNQLGEAAFVYLKSEAIISAKKTDDHAPIHIYRADGSLQRVIERL